MKNTTTAPAFTPEQLEARTALVKNVLGLDDKAFDYARGVMDGIIAARTIYRTTN